MSIPIMKKDRDKCVACDKETPYDKEEHIDKRYHYVEGAGQLCKTCWNEIYEKSKLDQ